MKSKKILHVCFGSLTKSTCNLLSFVMKSKKILHVYFDNWTKNICNLFLFSMDLPVLQNRVDKKLL